MMQTRVHEPHYTFRLFQSGDRVLYESTINDPCLSIVPDLPQWQIQECNHMRWGLEDKIFELRPARMIHKDIHDDQIRIHW